MATTVVAEETGRAKPRVGDRIFSGFALAAGIAILVALAGVFIFLAIEGVPGLAKPAEFYGDATNFWGYVAPLLFGTVLAAIIALIVAVPLAWGIALVVSHYAPKRIATPVAYVIDLLAAVPSVVFGLWGISVLAPQAHPGLRLARREHGLAPVLRRPGVGHRTYDPHRRPGAGDHDHPDHHRHLPRGVRADPDASTRRRPSRWAPRGGR